MESVPDNPSTPSEQFVTLMDAQTSITVSIPKTTGGMVTVVFAMANVIVLLL